ncbi:MAG: homocysteine S-methyltransferase family protein [Desulfobacteraceae bacterium]|nr:homocysteine S-methyltransferase family protein [Desulfobacteraceae bacterium]
MNFENIVAESKILLTEGGVVERIKRDPSVNLDPHIAHSGLIYDSKGKEALKKIYSGYIDVGKKYNLPFLSLAPTWRANPERIKKSVFNKHENINKDCVDFLKGIRDSYSNYSKNIFIGGLMACRGDAYRPEEALSKEDAKIFHKEQAEQLAESDVDFIKVATLPSVSEAYGMASAISSKKTPYILSFVINTDGTILDGTPIHEAIELIDTEIYPKPIFYMVNCVHPTIFKEAISKEINFSKKAIERIQGLQANTSSKSPDELDNLSYLDTSDPEEFGELMVSLHSSFGIKVLGGCCGSDCNHITEIAKKINTST